MQVSQDVDETAAMDAADEKERLAAEQKANEDALAEKERLAEQGQLACRVFCQRLIVSPNYERFFFVIICINTICLGMVYYDMPWKYEFALELMNYILTALFSIEFVSKVCCM
jgi:hypothetical protein